MHAINGSRSRFAVAGVESPSPLLRQDKQYDTLWYVVRCCSQHGALYAASNYHLRLLPPAEDRTATGKHHWYVSVTFAAVILPCIAIVQYLCRDSSASKALPADASEPGHAAAHTYSNGRVSCVTSWPAAENHPAEYILKKIWPQ